MCMGFSYFSPKALDITDLLKIEVATIGAPFLQNFDAFGMLNYETVKS